MRLVKPVSFVISFVLGVSAFVIIHKAREEFFNQKMNLVKVDLSRYKNPIDLSKYKNEEIPLAFSLVNDEQEKDDSSLEDKISRADIIVEGSLGFLARSARVYTDIKINEALFLSDAGRMVIEQHINCYSKQNLSGIFASLHCAKNDDGKYLFIISIKSIEKQNYPASIRFDAVCNDDKNRQVIKEIIGQGKIPTTSKSRSSS